MPALVQIMFFWVGRQAILWTNAGLWSVKPQGACFNEFWFRELKAWSKTHLGISSSERRLGYPCTSVVNSVIAHNIILHRSLIHQFGFILVTHFVIHQPYTFRFHSNHSIYSHGAIWPRMSMTEDHWTNLSAVGCCTTKHQEQCV